MKIPGKNQNTLTAETTQFSGIHGLDIIFNEIDPLFHERNSGDDWSLFDPDYLLERGMGEAVYIPRPIINEFTSGMFGIPFTEFRKTEVKEKRCCRYTYSWRNMINLYFCGWYPSNENSLTVEIKGGYFEHISWDEKAQAKLADYADSKRGKAKNWHSFIDDRILLLNFPQMKEYIDNHWFRSDYHPTQWTGKSNDSARGFQFGADSGKSVLKVYESGRYRRKKEDQFLDYLRLEMKLRDEHAHEAYMAWRAGNPLYEITRNRIASQVEFLPANPGKNKARARVKKLAPWWQTFVEGSLPFKMEKPKSNPNADAKLAARLRTFKKYLQELDPQQVAAEFLSVLQEETGGPTNTLSAALSDYFSAVQPKKPLL